MRCNERKDDGARIVQCVRDLSHEGDHLYPEYVFEEKPEKPLPVVPTLRDQFAMAALRSLLSRVSIHPDDAAESAYKIADAMLEERKKKA